MQWDCLLYCRPARSPGRPRFHRGRGAVRDPRSGRVHGVDGWPRSARCQWTAGTTGRPGTGRWYGWHGQHRRIRSQGTDRRGRTGRSRGISREYRIYWTGWSYWTAWRWRTTRSSRSVRGSLLSLFLLLTTTNEYWRINHLAGSSIHSFHAPLLNYSLSENCLFSRNFFLKNTKFGAKVSNREN